MYTYVKAAKDASGTGMFPATWYKKFKAEEQKEMMLSKDDADVLLTQHAVAESQWDRVYDFFVMEEKAQIAEASRKRQEANYKARRERVTIARRSQHCNAAIIAALTFSSLRNTAPHVCRRLYHHHQEVSPSLHHPHAVPECADVEDVQEDLDITTTVEGGFSYGNFTGDGVHSSARHWQLGLVYGGRLLTYSKCYATLR
ncbi:hypothetical protein BC940DRAFT_335760 [Gongronella butleri]|nr:hypothetical protein BC940DRAFT_335760 [Gongronella butleri]